MSDASLPPMVLIRSGRVVLPDGSLREADVRTEGPVIEKVEPGVSVPMDAIVIDARGCLVLPGLLDMHVHFREPNVGAGQSDTNDPDALPETIRTGTTAAAIAGVTTVGDMPNTDPATTTLGRLAAKRAIAQWSACVHYGPYFGASVRYLDDLRHLDPRHVPGVKVYMGASTGSLLAATVEEQDAIFEAAPAPVPIVVHAEDQGHLEENAAKHKGSSDPATHALVRDEATAVAATERAIALCRRHQRHVHIAHVSSAGEVELIKQAKGEGLPVTAEVTPHHLTLTADDYPRLGTRMVCNPAIREARHRDALWEGLKDGVIDIIATDHAPHPRTAKERPYPEAPSGVTGIDTALLLLLREVRAGRITYGDIARWCCQTPARLFGLPDRGRVETGARSDLVVVNPDLTQDLTPDRLHTRCGWSPWLSEAFSGWPVATVIDGHLVAKEGERVLPDGQAFAPATFRHPEP